MRLATEIDEDELGSIYDAGGDPLTVRADFNPEAYQQDVRRQLDPAHPPEGGFTLDDIRALAAQQQAAEPVARRPLEPAPQVTPALAAEKVVQTGQPNPDEFELAAAQVEDREARKRMLMERAGRELVAGLTRTPVAPTSQLPVDAVQRMLAMRRQRTEDRNAASGRDLQERRLAFDKEEAARKAQVEDGRRAEERTRREDETKWKRAEADENQQISRERLDVGRENAAANRAIAAAGLQIRQGEADRKVRDDEEKRSANSIPLFGATVELNPGLGDAERNKAREVASLWNAADAATGDLEAAIQAYVANPSITSMNEVNARVAAASTALNTAYGQGAMAEAEARRMKDTLGADLMSKEGAQALLGAMQRDPNAAAPLLAKLRAARSTNRNAAKARLGTYAGAKPAAAPVSGKVRVSNGSQTFEIDESDISAAEADGFKRVR